MAIRLICCLEDENMNNSSVLSKRFGMKLLCVFDHPISYSYDWAADSATDDFYGANIAGLVRAGALTISRARKGRNGVHVGGLFIDYIGRRQAGSSRK
jgi:hypothetical protein